MSMLVHVLHFELASPFASLSCLLSGTADRDLLKWWIDRTLQKDPETLL
jgi:hypothetical protein